MFGVSIGPPYEAIAENPTSSSTAYTTFGAPSGALAGSKGDQSGTESRMSTLILPLNGTLIFAPWSRPRPGSAARAGFRTRASPIRPRRTSSRWDERARRYGSEDAGPVILDADDRPTVGGGLVERLLGSCGIGELALGVVVQDEQAQERLVAVLAEVQHRDVAIGVAPRQQRPAARSTPKGGRVF